jgi:starch-binding outer membrane protein, SusD/RagB family
MKNIINTFHKQIVKGALITAFLLIAYSCEVIDLQPQTALSDVTAFDTPERISLTLGGMYDAAQSGTFAGGQVRGYPFGAAHIQQGDMRGEDMLNQALFYAITYESTFSAASANNVWHWNTLYRLINRANVVEEGILDAVERGIISAELGNAYVGECRFMRALAHYELVIHFCRPYPDGNGNKAGIPYRKVAITSPSRVQEEVGRDRGTVAEVYQEMLADLDFAETHLPATRSVVAGRNQTITRASKGAAIALKVRVNMHKADYPATIAESNKIISATAPFTSPIGGYILEGDVETVWANNYNNKEMIFAIEHNDVDNAGPNGSLAAMYPPTSINGRGLVRVSPISFNNPNWHPADARRAKLLLQDGRSYYTWKYRDIVNRSDAAPHLRYPDIMLYLAEALVRQSNSIDARALALLNAIRDRGLEGAAPSFTSADFDTPNDLIFQILEERRIEMLGEGRRWHEIHRLALDPDFSTGGIPAKMAFGNATFDTYDLSISPADLNKTIPFIPYADNRFVWPIPADELAQNPNLEQNPGY